MKRFIAALLSVNLLFLTGFTLYDKFESKDWQAIRAVTYSIGDMSQDFCAATKVSPTELLTAAHCVQEDDDIVVRDEGKVVGTAVVKARSAFTDVAVLTITEGVEGPYASLASQEVPRDAIVVAAGYPLDLGETLTEGVSQGPRDRCFYNEVGDSICAPFNFATSSITFGNSGGGLWVYEKFKGWRLAGVASYLLLQPGGSEAGFMVFVPYNASGHFASLESIKGILGV